MKKAHSSAYPYEWPDPTRPKGPFREVLLDVVGVIWRKLVGFKEQPEERPSAAGNLCAAGRPSEPDVFLSYAREDKERAARLAHELEGQGYSVFWDLRTPLGKPWRNHIFKALAEPRCVVVIWSTESISSERVIEEADEGMRRGVLIPVLYDNVLPPFGFRSSQAIDLTESTLGTRPHSLHDLLNEIAERVRDQE